MVAEAEAAVEKERIRLQQLEGDKQRISNE